MKHTESKTKKLLIALAVVVVIIHIAMYLALTFRIQQGEERIYSDLHELQVDVIKLKEGVQ